MSRLVACASPKVEAASRAVVSSREGVMLPILVRRIRPDSLARASLDLSDPLPRIREERLFVSALFDRQVSAKRFRSRRVLQILLCSANVIVNGRQEPISGDLVEK